MIQRQHHANGVTSCAVYSDCGHYRTLLMREWRGSGPKLAFVLLNPSTATELRNDPTIERCERRARALGYGAFRVANLFAYRATRPKELVLQADPVGPENDAAILESVDWADTVICAWGVHGQYLHRGPQVEHLLRARRADLFHLGLTQAGHPRHPLYVSYVQQPLPWP